LYGVTGQNQVVLITGFNDATDEKSLESNKTAFNEKVQDYLKTLPNEFVQDRYINIGKNF
jgi:hypothetical protein